MRRPLAALAPLAIDLWVLYGARLAPQPAVAALREAVGGLAVRVGAATSPALTQALDLASAGDLRTTAVGTQLFSTFFRGQIAPSRSGLAWVPADGWTLAGVLVALNLGMLLLSACMLLPLGDLIAGRHPRPNGSPSTRTFGDRLRQVGVAARSLLLVCLLIALFGAAAYAPILLSIGVLFNISPLASQLALTALTLIGIASWLLINLSAEAVIVGQARPLRAIYESYNIVRANIPQALLLFIALAVLTHGFAALLRPLTANTAGTIAALIVYAIVSGIVAATRMIFYQDRVVRLSRINPVALTKSEV